MIYPILRKRILRRIRDSFENILLNDTNHRQYDTYEKWLTEYFELSEEDQTNILTKFERGQTAAIIYAMRHKDREIFINQLGVFYIKRTTIDFYDSLERMIGDRQTTIEEYLSIKATALEETRALYIERANRKKNAKNSVKITFK